MYSVSSLLPHAPNLPCFPKVDKCSRSAGGASVCRAQEAYQAAEAFDADQGMHTPLFVKFYAIFVVP